MIASSAVIIVAIIIAICYIYIPDFFNAETIVIIAGIFMLIYLLFEDIPIKNNDGLIYGGYQQMPEELIHSHDNTLLNDEKDVPYMKMDLMDPKHNLREIAKQLILLEDHMAHKPKRCIDCITKHYLMTEGLLEEAITLDKTGEHIQEVRNITEQLKPVVMRIIDLIKNNKINDAEYESACQTLRNIRKKIALKYVMNN